jgi:hypothetical protein
MKKVKPLQSLAKGYQSCFDVLHGGSYVAAPLGVSSVALDPKQGNAQ